MVAHNVPMFLWANRRVLDQRRREDTLKRGHRPRLPGVHALACRSIIEGSRNLWPLLLCAMTALLAGCAVHQHSNVAHVPDWEDGDIVAGESPIAKLADPASVALPVPTNSPPTAANSVARPEIIASMTTPPITPHGTSVPVEPWLED